MRRTNEEDAGKEANETGNRAEKWKEVLKGGEKMNSCR
jgi:hypothetical protein